MKTSSHFVAGMLLIGIVIGSVALLLRNQNAIGKLSVANQNLLVASQETKRLTVENQQISRLSLLNDEAEKLRENNRELPKLRSEVHQLREQAKKLKGLRAENERLQTLRKNFNGPMTSVVLPPGFFLKSSLRDAGLDTPEAALQTFYWAMCQGDLNRWSQCLLGGTNRLQEDSDWQRKKFAEEMENFIGFQIAYKKVLAPDKVEIGLQAAVGGIVLPMKLRQIEKEWKVDH